MLADVVLRKGVSAGSLDSWGWRELKALPVSWFDELARIFTKVEDFGVWPDGLMDVLLGRGLFACFLLCIVFGLLLV